MTTPTITRPKDISAPRYIWPAVSTLLAVCAFVAAGIYGEWFTWAGAAAWLGASLAAWAEVTEARATARYLNEIRAELDREE